MLWRLYESLAFRVVNEMVTGAAKAAADGMLCDGEPQAWIEDWNYVLESENQPNFFPACCFLNSSQVDEYHSF
jgi:hypothetical protein